MYQDFFNFQKAPFSIAPDPRFLFMSEQHREALAHLLYGIQSSGAFVVLSGEVGSGKTTVCRCFLDQVPDNVDIAFILNPKLSAQELLASICDELSIAYENQDVQSTKRLIDAINIFLLENHSTGRNTVVIIEEAQNLSEDVLEQLRLLTNLETNEKKLLQIVLLAQPEFLDILKKYEMRQLEQRITARFHLSALNKLETYQYINHRLSVAGAKQDPFPASIKKTIYKESKGVPRLINLIADRCLLGAYANSKTLVSHKILKQAIKELKGEATKKNKSQKTDSPASLFLKVVLIIAILLVLAALILIKPVGLHSQFSNAWLNDLNQAESTSQKKLTETQNTKHKNPSYFTEPDQIFSFSEISNVHDEGSLSSQNDFSEAVALLSSLWGIQHTEPMLVNGPRSLCVFAAEQNLQCFSERANIGLLLKLGRPAILKFVGTEGQQYYGVLLGLNNDQLLVQFSGQQASLSFHELEKIWLGEFFLLVKMPEAWRGKILQEGDENAMSIWLNNALYLIQHGDSILSKINYPKSQVYSKEQVIQVKNIQRQAGIQDDGKVGVKTIIFINSLIENSVPRLEGVFTEKMNTEARKLK